MSDISQLSFVILCPTRNLGGLKSTVKSIQYHFADRPYLCVVGDDATDGEIKEFGSLCRTIKAGKTYSSLINKGVSETHTEWIMLFMAGMIARHGTLNKYIRFYNNNKQIM